MEEAKFLLLIIIFNIVLKIMLMTNRRPLKKPVISLEVKRSVLVPLLNDIRCCE